MGSNLFFASTGAVLDVVATAMDEALIGAWRERVRRAGAHLGWPDVTTVSRSHAGGVLLAVSAPPDELLLATEVNEWALCAALVERDPDRRAALQAALVAAAFDADPASDTLPVIDEAAALTRFEALAVLESKPRLRDLLDAAGSRELPYMLDETDLTLGAGVDSRTFALQELPAVDSVDWRTLSDIPTALVTGSNGKTTTVRLLVACCRAQGWHTAYNCTDGVYLDDTALAKGDYAGPAGARMALRNHAAQAAIVETARGGILRRGIAVSRAHVAIVTNISADHFGEYGIDDLQGLAQVKLSVAAAVCPGGLLVLNADDAQLHAQLPALDRRLGRLPPLGWFSANPQAAFIDHARIQGLPTCGPHAGRLRLHFGAVDHDLGDIAAMPLSMSGLAGYNIANLAGAALAAAALGVAPANIAAVFAMFGAKPTDNPGRMMRFNVGGATVLVDYAHNPDGLRGFLHVASQLRHGSGRLATMLGQAGNRKDADIHELVQVAVGYQPDLVIVKENVAQLRGRQPGEVTRVIRAELRRLLHPDAAVIEAADEVAGARRALDWARPGDVLALPLHSSAQRKLVMELLAGSASE